MLRPALILAAALLSVLWMGALRAEEEKVSRFGLLSNEGLAAVESRFK